jgi:hypothetical protein
MYRASVVQGAVLMYRASVVQGSVLMYRASDSAEVRY